jgi:cobalt-precorrin 5A hydrolase
MERHKMRVAGFGFRRNATVDSLRDALGAVGGGPVQVLATLTEKADAKAICDLATEMRLNVAAISRADLAAQPTRTHSPRVRARFGVGSLAEAAALAAAGPGARLIGVRAVSADGTATAAIAEGID